jgi:hypothetical protein
VPDGKALVVSATLYRVVEEIVHRIVVLTAKNLAEYTFAASTNKKYLAHEFLRVQLSTWEDCWAQLQALRDGALALDFSKR